MNDDITALIEETEHLLAILQYRAAEETSYDYVWLKIEKARAAFSRLTTLPLPEDIAGLIERLEKAAALMPDTWVNDLEATKECIDVDVAMKEAASALRALAQENERLTQELEEGATRKQRRDVRYGKCSKQPKPSESTDEAKE